jgi:hypothetical protein
MFGAVTGAGRLIRSGVAAWPAVLALAVSCALSGAAQAEPSRKASSGSPAPSTSAPSNRKASGAAPSSASSSRKSTSPAPAQSAAAEPLTVMDEKAEATFKEGIAAFDRRDFEAARVAFLQTFALKPGAPVVRRNLGLAEIYSGHYLEGARRLARVLHTTTDEGSAEDRARMLESLKKAEAHLERVSVEVRQEGAEILIDGVDLGTSPLPFLWYVAPGGYDVRVQKAGFADHFETRVAQAGVAQHLVIVLAPLRSEPPPRAALPAPVEAARTVGPNGWLLLTGGALTAAGLATGAALSIAASNNKEKVDRLGTGLEPPSICADVPSTPPCPELERATQTHDRQQVWALASFAAAGVTGVATLLYGLLGGGSAEPAGEGEVASRPGSRFSAGWAGANPYLFWSGQF